jgi:hypothetical protein
MIEVHMCSSPWFETLTLQKKKHDLSVCPCGERDLGFSSLHRTLVWEKPLSHCTLVKASSHWPLLIFGPLASKLQNFQVGEALGEQGLPL